MNTQLDLLQPVARTSDPESSQQAARRVRAGNAAIVKAIRLALFERGPMTSWEVADAVREQHGDRWASESIRTACARSRLVVLANEGVSPRGNAASLYCLRGDIANVKVDSGVL